jgi:3-oxoacyl-[acyl-carrier protein] reductase
MGIGTRYEGKRAIVTGAARGIGLSISRLLAGEGARVAMVDLDQDALDAAGSNLIGEGGQCVTHRLDVADPEAVKEAVAAVARDWGGVDFLVNNAGITRDGLLLRMKKADWDLVLRVNLDSVFHFSQAVLKPMIKARQGRIVSIGSVVGVMGNPGQANYAASKAGIIGFSRSLAREVAPRGITVNVVAPGFIDTEMTAGLSDEVRRDLLSRVPLGRLGSVDDIARSVAFLLGDDSAYITGQVLGVNGGMYM